MSEKGRTTRRGRPAALLAFLEYEKHGPGRYLVEGYYVLSVSHTAWDVHDRGGRIERFRSFTEALEWITWELEDRRG